MGGCYRRRNKEQQAEGPQNHPKVPKLPEWESGCAHPFRAKREHRTRRGVADAMAAAWVDQMAAQPLCRVHSDCATWQLLPS